MMAISKQNLLQAEAIGARYASDWTSRHSSKAALAAVAPTTGGGGGGGKAAGGAAGSTPLLAGTKFDPFAADGGTQVRRRC